MCVVPFWYKPWKCRLVLSLPSEFFTLTMTWSPLVATIAGTGHFPFTPITGRVACPSGFAYVQATSKSYVTVAQCAIELRRVMGRRKLDRESAILSRVRRVSEARERSTTELSSSNHKLKQCSKLLPRKSMKGIRSSDNGESDKTLHSSSCKRPQTSTPSPAYQIINSRPARPQKWGLSLVTQRSDLQLSNFAR
jgi:hypothetical protein